MAEEKKVVNVRFENGLAYDDATGKHIETKVLKSHLKKHELRVVDISSNNLAVGMHINQYEKTAIRFLKDLLNYNDNSNDIFSQMDISNKMYRFEDVVATGLEILIDFTISGYELTGISDELKPIIEHFDRNVNYNPKSFVPYGMKQLMIELASEHFVSGNIYPAETWKQVTIEGKKYWIPARVKLLNPSYIKVENSVVGGNSRLLFQVGGQLHRTSTNVEDLFEDMRLQPLESPVFKGTKLVSDKDLRQFREVNTDIVSHLKRKSRDYEAYGTPYLTKLAQAVTYKQKLWQLDLNTIDGLMNFITIFRIGSKDTDSPFHIPPPERITYFQSLLSNPQASTMMVWPHDVDVITAGPDGNVLSFGDKYKEANRAIIQGLGVPPILIDGSGTATAAWVTILALNKRLELVRWTIKNYLEHLFKKIAIKNEMEITGKETIEWFPSELRNEAQIKQLLLNFYDRGLLPIKTTHNAGGYPHEELLELKKDELDRGLDDIFTTPDLPFSSPNEKKEPVEREKQGRPTEQPSEPNPEATLTVGHSTHMFKDRYIKDAENILDSLEENIAGMKKASKGMVEKAVFVAFVRLQQLADVYSNFEQEITDNEIAAKLKMIHGEQLGEMQEEVSKRFTKLAIKEITREEKDLMYSGLIAKLKKELLSFVEVSLTNIDVAKLLSKKKDENYTSVVLSIEGNEELSGVQLSMIDAMETLSKHQDCIYELTFVKAD